MKPCSVARAAAAIALSAALLPFAAFAQSLDLGGWQLRQANSIQTETFPAGTLIQPGGYLILARYASRAQFETYYGVTLGTNVTFLTHANATTGVPQINGDEIFTLVDAAAAVIDGPTPAITTLGMAYHRDDPEAAPWTSINALPTPGYGVEAPDATASGVVISEACDATLGTNAYYYEFIELYYDVVSDGNAAPVIEGTSATPTAPSYTDSVVVTTTVTDSDGALTSVVLKYRFGTASFTTLAMSPTGDDGFRAVIDPLQGNTNLDYYIEAADDDGAITRDPAGAPTSVYSIWVQGPAVAGKVVLFDHAHGQDAGTEGNWRVDDNYPYPLPATPSSESDWIGQLSSWAFELYTAGHTIKSNTTPLDAAALLGVDLVIIVEPQNPFAPEEIDALAAFVRDGGSLFVVANHNGSDRDADGWDSPSIFGGYAIPHISVPVGDDVETFCGARFGLHFHVKDEGDNSITGTFANVDTDPSNPLINGPFGHVSAVIYHVGDVMALWPTANPDLTSVAGHIWKDGETGNPDVNIAAWSRYGEGKVVGYGDSSSCADGTDSEPHASNWTEIGSNNREFFLNATWWLLQNDLTGVGGDAPAPWGIGLRAAPNPFNPSTRLSFTLPQGGPIEVAVFGLRGERVRTLLAGERDAGAWSVEWNGRNDAGRACASGVYVVRATTSATVELAKIVLAK